MTVAAVLSPLASFLSLYLERYHVFTLHQI